MGDRKVGKTAILNRYVYDNYQEYSMAAIEAEFFIKREEIDGNNILLQLCEQFNMKWLRPTVKILKSWINSFTNN